MCVCMIILVIGHKQWTVVFIKHRVHGRSYVLGAPGRRWKNHKRFSPGMMAMWVTSWWKSSWWIPCSLHPTFSSPAMGSPVLSL